MNHVSMNCEHSDLLPSSDHLKKLRFLLSVWLTLPLTASDFHCLFLMIKKKKINPFFHFQRLSKLPKNSFNPLGIRVRDKSTLRTWVWTAVIHFCSPKNKVPRWAIHLRAGLRDHCVSLSTQNILWYGNYIPFHHSSQTKGKHSHLHLTFSVCFPSLKVYLAWEGVHF